MAEVSKTANYRVNDFIEKGVIGEYKTYALNKICVIFSQEYEPIEI